eukprot:Rmarinus@m.17671
MSQKQSFFVRTMCDSTHQKRWQRRKVWHSKKQFCRKKLLVDNGAKLSDADYDDLYTSSLKTSKHLSGLWAHFDPDLAWRRRLVARMAEQKRKGGIRSLFQRSKSQSWGSIMKTTGEVETSVGRYALLARLLGTNDGEMVRSICEMRRSFDLMLWAVLHNKFELAKFYWGRSEQHPIRDALTCVQLFRALANERLVPIEMSPFLEENALRFEELATGILLAAYHNDNRKALKVMGSPARLYGKSITMLDLAFKAGAESFVSTECAQTALKNRWFSRIKESRLWRNDHMFFVTLGILCPPLVPVLIDFDDDENDSHYSTARFDDGPPRTINFGKYTLETFARFYGAAVTKFVENALLYVAFLVLYSSVTLSVFPDHFQLTEGVLLVWTTAMLLEEWVQLRSFGFFRWWGSVWNRIDLMIFVLYYLSLIYRIRDLSDPDHFLDLRYDGPGSQAKMLMCIGVIFNFLRILSTFSINATLGPLLVTMEKMVSDILVFLFIFVTFILGFGIAFQGTTDPFNWSAPTNNKRIQNILEMPYWATYGELFLDDIEPYPLAKVLLVFYMIVANVLLVNLLIAMMGSTYSRVSERSHTVWLFQSYETIEEFRQYPFLPPPFSALSRMWHGFDMMCGCFFSRWFRQQAKRTPWLGWLDLTRTDKAVQREEIKLTKFVLKGRDQYLSALDDEQKNSISGRIDLLIDLMYRFEKRSSDVIVEGLAPEIRRRTSTIPAHRVPAMSVGVNYVDRAPKPPSRRSSLS